MKKKLLFSPYAQQWNSLVAKFFRLYRRISSHEFSENYSEQQQRRLIGKLKSLFSRLDRMQHQVGIKLAGTALFFMLASSTSFAQQVWRPVGSADGKIPLVDVFTSNVFPGIAVADLDEDGSPDIFIGYKNGSLRMIKNDGSGGFPDAGVPVMAGGVEISSTKYAAPAFADLDGDGDLDLFVSDYDNKAIKYYKNNGLGVFTAENNLKADGAEIFGYPSFAFADVDKDGDLDLYCGRTAGNIEVYINNGGAFTRANPGFLQADRDTLLFTSAGKGTHKYSAPAFADIDKDGALDLYVGGGDSHNIMFFKNNAGTFNFNGDLVYADSTEVILDPGNYSRPTFADMDGEGDLELLVVDKVGAVRMFKYVETLSSVNITEENPIEVYPNPVKDILYLNGLKDLAKVEIFNLIGAKVAIYENVKERLNISSLSPGMYFMTITADRKKYSGKLIKE